MMLALESENSFASFTAGYIITGRLSEVRIDNKYNGYELR